MIPRPSEPVVLPGWLEIASQYDDDHEATVTALVALYRYSRERRLAAQYPVTEAEARRIAAEKGSAQ